MGKTIDACGLTCPAPVLLVKDAVEQTNEQEITVLVDNAASMENVTRFLGSKGYSVTDSQEGGIFRLEARCDSKVSPASHAQSANKQSGDNRTEDSRSGYQ